VADQVNEEFDSIDASYKDEKAAQVHQLLAVLRV